MIVRGTTPTMTFELPYDANIFTTGFVIMKQNNAVVVEKALHDCECNNNILSVKLSQKDTLSLKANINCRINLVLKTNAGDRIESLPVFEQIEDTSKDGEI